MRFSGRPAATDSSTWSRSLPDTAARLVGQPAGRQPGRRARRAGSDGVAADAVAGVDVGHQPRQRQERGLRHRVLGHAGAGTLSRGRRDVDDGGVLGATQVRQRRPYAAHVAHHVGVPCRLPLGVVDLLERADLGDADVVDQPVQAAQRRDRLGDRGAAPARASPGRRRPRPRRSDRPRARGLRDAIATRAPSAISSSAVARPIPALPPVTSTRRSRSCKSI